MAKSNESTSGPRLLSLFSCVFLFYHSLFYALHQGKRSESVDHRRFTSTSYVRINFDLPENLSFFGACYHINENGNGSDPLRLSSS